MDQPTESTAARGLVGLPSQAELHELFDYDEKTGLFTYRVCSGRRIRVGMVAGTKKGGYIRIRIRGIGYRAHRLAWVYVHGENPGACMDHINGITTDNRIANLRLASVAEYNQNRVHAPPKSSGLRGVNFDPDGAKWRARIYINRKPIDLGRFDKKEDAASAYADAKRRLHPFHRSL